MSKKRKFIFLSFLILGVLLLTSCFLKPPPTEGILKGQVMVPEGTVQEKDLAGQVLPDATVNIINLTSGEIIATTTTDSNGTYQVFVPAGGPYLLEAVKGGVKLEQITCPVEVGIEYDLGTADCVTTAAALIAQTMIGAGTDPTDINCAAIQADSNFNNVASIVCSTIQAGGDPTASAAIQEAIENFLNPPPPAPPPTYTVTYHGNDSTGGTVPEDSLSPYKYGATVTVLDNTGSLVKTGYTLSGWNTEADGSGTDQAVGSNFFMGAANVTLYAQWTINTYTVTFDSQGGSSVDSQTINYGEKVTEPTDPTRTGYTFIGWYKESECTTVWDFDSDTVTADVILYAQWTINTYTVTFDNNSGDTEADPTTKTATYGGNVGTLPNEPAKTGYTFASWNTEAGGGGTEFTATTEVFADITVYAQWTINSYTVTYHSNGSTDGTVPEDSLSPYEYGETVTLLDNMGSLVKTGFTFSGWNTEADGSGTDQAVGSNFIMGAADVILYAQWNANNYTITFDKNDVGATGTMAYQTIASDSSANLTACAFTKLRWRFTGWATTSGGAVEYADQANYTMGTADVTLYAKWRLLLIPPIPFIPFKIEDLRVRQGDFSFVLPK